MDVKDVSTKKNIASLVSLAYTILLAVLAVLCLFYTVVVPHKIVCAIGLCIVCAGVLWAMLFSRNKLLTRICSVALLPVLLPTVLMCFGEWALIVPLVVTALLAFFLCGCSETTKTVWGTVYLLLYVLGSLVYFLSISLFSTGAVSEVVGSGISASGKYRHEIINTQDSSNGNTKVIVEPNDHDIPLGLFSLRAESYERTMSLMRPIQEEVNVRWEMKSRQDITQELLAISPDVTISLSDSNRKVLGYDSSTVVYLRNLTDGDLARMGVPQQNDVMYVNDEVCYRSYLAVLEGYFNSSLNF